MGFMSLARFLKPCVMEDSHLELVRKARANLNNKQLFCLKVLHTWQFENGFYSILV